MSNLLVQNIKHTNNTTAQTIDTSGRTTAVLNNDTTYRSDNGAVTQNMVQGLAKSWQDLNGETFGSNDSFNVSGNTDHQTGEYTNSYTNSMASANYHFSGYCGDPGSKVGNFHISDSPSDAKQASSTRYFTVFVSNTTGSGSSFDTEHTFLVVHGDLA